MAKKIDNRDFFTRDAVSVAQDLLGKIICHEKDGFVIRGRIKATEAYRKNDDVTDANRETKKTAQFLTGGHLYFYNKKGEGRQRIDIVANNKDVAESVLIRWIDSYCEGPQIAVWALDIDPEDNGIDLLDKDSKIWIEDDGIAVVMNDPQPRKGLSENAETKKELLYFSAKEFIFK